MATPCTVPHTSVRDSTSATTCDKRRQLEARPAACVAHAPAGARGRAISRSGPGGLHLMRTEAGHAHKQDTSTRRPTRRPVDVLQSGHLQRSSEPQRTRHGAQEVTLSACACLRSFGAPPVNVAGAERARSKIGLRDTPRLPVDSADPPADIPCRGRGRRAWGVRVRACRGPAWLAGKLEIPASVFSSFGFQRARNAAVHVDQEGAGNAPRVAADAGR